MSDPLFQCEWTQDGLDGEEWGTDCGESWTFIVGGPVKNRMRFCCFCGKRLVEVMCVEPEDTDE